MAIKVEKINGKNIDGTLVVDLFADEMPAIKPTNGKDVIDLTEDDEIGFGSSIFSADRKIAFMKSDRTWEE